MGLGFRQYLQIFCSLKNGNPETDPTLVLLSPNGFDYLFVQRLIRMGTTIFDWVPGHLDGFPYLWNGETELLGVVVFQDVG